MLQVRLLGAVAAERDGEQLSLQPPVSRLLAFLAVRPGPHDRETVAAPAVVRQRRGGRAGEPAHRRVGVAQGNR